MDFKKGQVTEVRDRSYLVGPRNAFSGKREVVKEYELVVHVYDDDEPPGPGTMVALMPVAKKLLTTCPQRL